MKAVIIDDEKRSADNLRILLGEHCTGVEVVAISYDAKEGIEVVQKLKPELLFLDIEMPFADGFSVVDALRETKPHIIFTTAFSEYAVKAFRVDACDYLLKPIDPAELRAAVNKASAQQANDEEMLKRIEALETRIKHRRTKLAVQGTEGYLMVEYSEIIRLEASSNYTHIYCKNNRKYTVAKVLKDFEEQLSGEGFFRTHSSHLVNLAYVAKYIRGDGGYIAMADGVQIEVSRSRKKDLLRILLGEE